MIKREEVEVLVRAATMGESVFPIAVSYVALAELCRTWLSVDSAQSAEITREDWLENFRQISADMIGQRVKLVLVPEAGGGEG